VYLRVFGVRLFVSVYALATLEYAKCMLFQVQPKVQVQPGSVLQSPGISPRIVLASPYGMQAACYNWLHC